MKTFQYYYNRDGLDGSRGRLDWCRENINNNFKGWDLEWIIEDKRIVGIKIAIDDDEVAVLFKLRFG